MAGVMKTRNRDWLRNPGTQRDMLLLLLMYRETSKITPPNSPRTISETSFPDNGENANAERRIHGKIWSKHAEEIFPHVRQSPIPAW